LEYLHKVAFMTIGRACGFGVLAIFCITVSFAFDFLLAARAAAILTTIMTMILLVRAQTALKKDLRKTEMWIYLDENTRPPEPFAQQIGSAILRETYLWFAYRAAAFSIAFWVIAIAISLFR